MPLSTSRGSRHGRPRPSSRIVGLGRSASTAAHCSSVRSIATLDHEVDPPSIVARFALTYATLDNGICGMRSRLRIARDDCETGLVSRCAHPI